MPYITEVGLQLLISDIITSAHVTSSTDIISTYSSVNPNTNSTQGKISTLEYTTLHVHLFLKQSLNYT